jgi:hypothetical protein
MLASARLALAAVKRLDRELESTDRAGALLRAAGDQWVDEAAGAITHADTAGITMALPDGPFDRVVGVRLRR